MEIGEIVSVSVVFVAIVLWNLITVWQIPSQGNRLIQEIRTQSAKTRDVESEQARCEGANSMLSDVLKQRSHTHKT